MDEIFGIFIVDVDGRGLMRFSSFIVGFVFFIDIEVGIDFVDDEFIFVDFICRESIDDRGLEIPLLLLFADVCDWVVLGLNGNADDDDALLTDEFVGLTGSWEVCFCCWLVLVIWGVFEDEIRGFLVTDDDARDFGSVLIGIDFVSGTFFLSSFVVDRTFVFLIDWTFEELVDWVLGFDIGIVIVSFDCLLSLVDDEIGLVLVEIFLISVFVVVDEEEEEDSWVVFFGTVDDDIVGFLDVVAVDADVLLFVFL